MSEEKRDWFGFLLRRELPPIGVPFRKKSLLSDAELVFYNVLKEAVGERFVILLKVGVRDLVEITQREVNKVALNRIAAEQIDFVLCDQDTLHPVVAIELDDSTLYPRDRAARDAFINELFRVIGVALIRHRVQPAYDTLAIERWVEAALTRLRPAS